MVKVQKSKDCGNSPKNTFAQEFAVALLAGKAQFLKAASSEDILWVVSRSKSVEGIKNLLEEVEKGPQISLLKIDHVTTHGKVGAVSGALRANGEERSFCISIEFSSVSAKQVKKVITYWLI